MSYFTLKQNDITLNIKVKTNKKQTKLSGVENNCLVVELASLPIEGKANKELISFLAEVFQIPKSHIELIGGEKWKNKIVQLPKNEKIIAILKKMEPEADDTLW
jgi:uncharacterized protein (TIGR00251 family)